VRADRRVGCGLCQTRCYRLNVKSKQLLTSSAVVVEAGAGKEDRLRDGSYCELRKSEHWEQEPPDGQRGKEGPQDGYLLDFLKETGPRCPAGAGA
jgi:hypothetical protein